MLSDGLSKLEANSQFDLKFYNTYGKSTLYNISRTNINITCSIITTRELSDIDKNTIRDYIRRVVDAANDSGNLSISDIYTACIANFNTNEKVIRSISINSVNGEIVEYIYQQNKENADLIVPEYLTLSFNPDEIERSITFRTI
jgi:hypothetical protein